MLSEEEILRNAHTTISLEAEAITGLLPKLTNGFAKAVLHILQSNGRVVVTGIGKSANIAQKITATLNSTGTPALFMHAADAVHGDLGMIQQGDTVLCISKSGDTAEIKLLTPLLKQGGNKLIALVGNTDSYLANHADLVLDCTVAKEACPHNLAPTSSTTAQLVLGDALAVALLECRGFGSEDFARFHPGGALGKRLYLRVGDILKNTKPTVQTTDEVKTVISSITAGRMGAAVVLKGTEIAGIVTDGDLRRMMEKHDSLVGIKAADIMNPSPKTIDHTTLAAEALQTMREQKISQLLVLKEGQLAGLVHLHDLMSEGIV